ncbi:hypothetical protein KKG83_05180 [Candidatus Micrarchaeota archaeon]|nr:hypothetical protein [Candidatus Micrarchaeota archaeon]MBU2476837.1 hypothetical protein [Candidatus Micrarchaeota archaeon]
MDKIAARIGFISKSRRAFQIYEDVMPKLYRLYSEKRVPSKNELREINSAINEMKEFYGFIFVESLELDKIYSSKKIKDIRHDLKDNFLNLVNYINMLKKYNIVGFEKLET